MVIYNFRNIIGVGVTNFTVFLLKFLLNGLSLLCLYIKLRNYLPKLIVERGLKLITFFSILAFSICISVINSIFHSVTIISITVISITSIVLFSVSRYPLVLVF